MSPRDRVAAFAPATVGNVICGFDVLGLALERPGDRVVAHRTGEEGVVIRSVTGDGGRIPLEARRNSAGVAALALLERSGSDVGVALEVEKGLPLSGGMGGSAASAAAAVVAVDALLELNSGSLVLLECAMEGERAASGSAHADNVAPSLRGGIVLVRPGSRRPVVPLPVPPGLSVALLHPRAELRTSEARAVLPASVPLEDAIVQWGNTAALVAGLFRDDLDLVADALEDRVAEPARSARISGFDVVREAAVAQGAVGFGISGAGPSMLALSSGLDEARRVGDRMKEAYDSDQESGSELHVSPIPPTGAHVVDGEEEETA